MILLFQGHYASSPCGTVTEAGTCAEHLSPRIDALDKPPLQAPLSFMSEARVK